MRRLPAAGVLAGALGLACGDAGLGISGDTGEAIPAVLVGNLFFVESVVNGSQPLLLGLDTGAPVLTLDTTEIAQCSEGDDACLVGPRGVEARVDSLDVLGLEVRRARFVATDLFGEGEGLGGLVGCSVLCEFSPSFNYRDVEVALDRTIDPPDLLPGVDVAFDLEGGGRALDRETQKFLRLPKSRILVDAEIEGTPLRLLLDTGASFTTLRERVKDAIVTDGRAELGTGVTGMFGMASARVFRVREMSMGDAQVTGVLAATAPLDALFDGLEAETGEPLDGVVGATFLREFHVRIDYRERTVQLAPYATRDHVADEAVRVGFTLERDAAGSYFVRTVNPGSDAQTGGVTVGEEVIAVDGEPLSGLVPADAQLLLNGRLGQVKAIEFRCRPEDAARCGTFDGTRTVVVDIDLLALP